MWPHLIVTKREAKAIRAATIEYLRAGNTTDALTELLNISYPDGYDVTSDMSPWEEIYDAAPIEGASLKMPFNDKGQKPDPKDKKTGAKLENRPKVPKGTYIVDLMASDLEAATNELMTGPDEKDDIKWLTEGSIRLDMDNPPPVANIWVLASQMRSL